MRTPLKDILNKRNMLVFQYARANIKKILSFKDYYPLQDNLYIKTNWSKRQKINHYGLVKQYLFILKVYATITIK